MRKIVVSRTFGIVLFVVYVSLLITDLFYDYLKDLQAFILSIVLALIGLNLLFKGVILKSDSTIWFAMTLLFMAIAIIIFDILKVDPSKYYFVYAVIPIISSLINLAILKNLFYIKVIILNVSICVPIFIDYFVNLNTIYTLLLYVASIIVGIVVCRLIRMEKEKV